jgi:hypothetical protein
MHGIVSDVIAGSLITQRANKLGIDTEQLLNSSTPEAIEIYAALTELGLSPDVTAAHTLISISVFLKNPEIVDAHINKIAKLLWNALGDPDNNGDTPPESYKDAADCVYTWLIFTLIPSRSFFTNK